MKEGLKFIMMITTRLISRARMSKQNPRVDSFRCSPPFRLTFQLLRTPLPETLKTRRERDARRGAEPRPSNHYHFIHHKLQQPSPLHPPFEPPLPLPLPPPPPIPSISISPSLHLPNPPRRLQNLLTNPPTLRQLIQLSPQRQEDGGTPPTRTKHHLEATATGDDEGATLIIKGIAIRVGTHFLRLGGVQAGTAGVGAVEGAGAAELRGGPFGAGGEAGVEERAEELGVRVGIDAIGGVGGWGELEVPGAPGLDGGGGEGLFEGEGVGGVDVVGGRCGGGGRGDRGALGPRRVEVPMQMGLVRLGGMSLKVLLVVVLLLLPRREMIPMGTLYPSTREMS